MKKILILASAAACLSFTDSYNAGNSHSQSTQREDAYSRNYGQYQTDSQQSQNTPSQYQNQNNAQNNPSPAYYPRAAKNEIPGGPFGSYNQRTYRKPRQQNNDVSYYQTNQYNVPYGGGTSYNQNNSNELYYQDNSKAPDYPNVSQDQQYQQQNYQNPYYQQQQPNPNYQQQPYYQQQQQQPYYQGPYSDNDNSSSEYYYDPNTGSYTTGVYGVPSEGYRTYAGNHPPHGPYCNPSAFNAMGGLNTPYPDFASQYNPGLGR